MQILRKVMSGLVLSSSLLASCGAPRMTYSEPRSVSWEQAIRAIRENVVRSVIQGHDLSVRLNLKDGSILETVEPVIDEIAKAIAACEQCDSIQYLTE